MPAAMRPQPQAATHNGSEMETLKSWTDENHATTTEEASIVCFGLLSLNQLCKG